MTRNLILAGIIGAASFTVVPAYALTAKECSVKYQAAKTAGTLGGAKWNDFRKTQCADASPAAAAPAPAAPTKAAKTTAAAPKAAAPADSGGGLTMKECSAKYQAAKTAGTLGGQKWNDFRKAQCSGDAAATAPAAAPTKATKTATAPADASTGGGLTMKECSAKYQAAKTAGTLGGQKWNDFRKAQCSSGAAAAATDDDTAPTPQTATYKDEPPAATTAAPAGVGFPKAVSAKYSTESAGKARMHTCLEQYYANKQNNTLGGLKWIQKGGGYYSLCNSRLKS
ncbi:MULTISPECIES: hypothetical protein [unclassified Phyllobacterium]|uniref:hypothetical protein n=2 Tax=Phyllobacterium TaxID=28100 RepID=UPI001D146B48|nr:MULTISPECIES: hypothetical protein [unclassified Phyllobacterium]UGX88005.1 hypothetical protein LLE53_003985 [Phyllobacterium sp. T1293]